MKKDEIQVADAIKILASKMDGSVDTSYEWCEAVRMAINALRTETKQISANWVRLECEGLKFSQCSGGCGGFICGHVNYRYCPNCGAKMNGEGS